MGTHERDTFSLDELVCNRLIELYFEFGVVRTSLSTRGLCSLWESGTHGTQDRCSCRRSPCGMHTDDGSASRAVSNSRTGELTYAGITWGWSLKKTRFTMFFMYIFMVFQTPLTLAEMTMAMGIDMDSPGMIEIFESPAKKPPPLNRKKSSRRTTMMQPELRQSLRQSSVTQNMRPPAEPPTVEGGTAVNRRRSSRIAASSQPATGKLLTATWLYLLYLGITSISLFLY